MASHSHSQATSSGISLLVALGLHAGVFLLSPDSIEASTSRPTVVELEFAPLPTVPSPVKPALPPVAPVRRAKRVVAPRVPKPAAGAETQTPSAASEASSAVVEESPAPASPLPAAAPTLPLVDPSSTELPLPEPSRGGGATGAGLGVSGLAMHGSGTGHTASASGRGTSATGARAVQLASKRWECPWPAEAESEDIHEQLVAIRVLVNEQGVVERVDVLSDPGYGFGAAARRCARAARFASALDAQGRVVRAHSPPIHVRFVR